jgi:GT2 family glycosyltransferase
VLRRGLEVLRDEGPAGAWRRARRKLLGAQAGVFRDYPRWLRAGLQAEVDGPAPSSPLQVAVVVPVCDPPPWALDALLVSIRAQEGVAWRLVLSDDGSRDPAVRARLEAAARDPRVRVVAGLERRGISAATNVALAAAEGDLVAFVDHDDALAPGALAHVAAAFADPAVGWAYTDEDKLLGQPGERARPFFKPAFDPTLLLRCNPTAHLLVARRDLVAQVGGLRSEFDGSQDYDLALRLAETGRAVAHVPRLLYHWRAVPGSTADRVAAKPWAYVAARRAIADALLRRGVGGRVEPGAWLGSYRVALEPRVAPGEVSVVLDADRVPAWLRALPWGEVLTGAGGSSSGRAARAAAARGRWLLFLGDVRPPGRGDPARAGAARERLGALLAEADRPGVGFVAARLAAGRGGRILEHGLRVARDGRCVPVEATLDEGDPGYFGLATLTRSVGAASGQALLVARSTLDGLGGLDAARFAGGGAAVDLCRRAAAAGLRTVSVAEATLEVARGREGLGLEVDRAALAAAGPLADPWTSPHWRHDALALAGRPGSFAPRVR